jgi:hypothetical protein
MKSPQLTVRPRLLATISALFVLGLVISFHLGIHSSTPVKVEAKVVPEKLYNEDLFDWFNVTFLPLTIEDTELTEILVFDFLLIL